MRKAEDEHNSWKRVGIRADGVSHEGFAGRGNGVGLSPLKLEADSPIV